jgi:hypothetical protein
MLSVTLGPGMLGVIYDGLQNPLVELAEQDGFFLKRGRDLYPLDRAVMGFPTGQTSRRSRRRRRHARLCQRKKHHATGSWPRST